MGWKYDLKIRMLNENQVYSMRLREIMSFVEGRKEKNKI